MNAISDDEKRISVTFLLTWFCEKYHLREVPRIIVSGSLSTPKGEPSLGVFDDKTNALFLSEKLFRFKMPEQLETTVFHEMHHFMDWLNAGKKPSLANRNAGPGNPYEDATEQLAREDWIAFQRDVENKTWLSKEPPKSHPKLSQPS